MVLRDESRDLGRKAVAFRKGQAVGYVVADASGAQLGREVRVRAELVLHRVLDVVAGLRELADVVEHRTHPGKFRVGADTPRGRFRQGGYHHAVVVGAGRFVLEAAKKWVVAAKEGRDRVTDTDIEPIA